MKYIKLFESDITDMVSDEFWTMVDIVDWGAVIKGYRKSPTYHQDYVNWNDQAKGRLYVNYPYDKVKNFKHEYLKIYYELYDKFDGLDCGVSDDGYTDLISSVVGKGKEWVKKCIENPNLVENMGRQDKYMENFGYLFSVSKEDYWKILDKYYPNDTRVVARKYNL
jgi:hypothetical protein